MRVNEYLKVKTESFLKDAVHLIFKDFGCTEKRDLNNFPSCSNEVNFQQGSDQNQTSDRCAHRIVVRDTSASHNDDMAINFMKPHPNTDSYDKDKDLIGLVVYGRHGKQVKEGTGEFGFKDPKELKQHANVCKPDTQHARCYKELYGRCPEEENRLVASGFANKKKYGLKFNSTTLNDKDQSYLDSNYYKPEKSRQVGQAEQDVIENTVDAWTKDGCPKSNCVYSTNTAVEKKQ